MLQLTKRRRVLFVMLFCRALSAGPFHSLEIEKERERKRERKRENCVAGFF